jgi:DNA-binding XRE family transcriptional regulator
MAALPSQPTYMYHTAPSVSQPTAVRNRDISERFGERLRELRKSRRMTQLDMAVAFGIDRSYISDLECGKKGLSLATLEVFALGFKIELPALLSDL